METNVKQIVDFVNENLNGEEWKIILADNASSDQTPKIGKKMSENNSKIAYCRVDEKGKGAAVLSAWKKHPADINIFMDIDLSVDLSDLPRLIQEIAGGADIALGSRRAAGSKARRLFSRSAISFTLHLILYLVFGTKIKDTACGFKAISKKILEEIVPEIKNRSWFFDTEMVLLAEKRGYRIKEIPVLWREPEARKSTVGIMSATKDYLKEIKRLKRDL